MGEPELVVPRGDDERGPFGQFQGVEDLLDVLAEGAAQGLEAEPLADHRRGAEHVLDGRAEARHPLGDHLPHALGEPGGGEELADLPAAPLVRVQGAALHQVSEHLHGEERVAPRLEPQRVGERHLGVVEVVAREVGDEGDGLRVVEPTEREALDHGLARSVARVSPSGAPSTTSVSRNVPTMRRRPRPCDTTCCSSCSVGRSAQCRSSRTSTTVASRVSAASSAVTAPNNTYRWVSGSPAGVARVPRRSATAGMRWPSSASAAGVSSSSTAGPVVDDEMVERLDPRLVRPADLLLAAAVQDDRRAGLGVDGQPGDERRLAHPRLAPDEHDPGLSGVGLAEQRREALVLAPPPDERGPGRGDEPGRNRRRAGTGSAVGASRPVSRRSRSKNTCSGWGRSRNVRAPYWTSSAWWGSSSMRSSAVARLVRI